MTDPARIITATFYTWRPVVGRKRLQLVFEVPLEETNDVLTMLGPPLPDRHIPVAIALLDPNAGQNKPNIHPDISEDRGDLADEDRDAGIPLEADPPLEAHRPFYELPYPSQAALKSKDLMFTCWMSTTDIGKECNDDCEAAIKKFCGVTRKRDILPNTKAGAQWLRLLRAFDENRIGFR